MMKVFTATRETQGRRASDFSDVPEGELVTFGVECDSDSTIDDRCGCQRSLVGTLGRKATTTFKVEEVSLTLEDLAAIILESEKTAGISMTTKQALTVVQDLVRLAGQFDAGDVVERRGTDFLKRPAKKLKVQGEGAVFEVTEDQLFAKIAEYGMDLQSEDLGERLRRHWHYEVPEDPVDRFLETVALAMEPLLMCEVNLPRWFDISEAEYDRGRLQARREALRLFWMYPEVVMSPQTGSGYELLEKTEGFCDYEKLQPCPICNQETELVKGLTLHQCSCGEELTPCVLCRLIYSGPCDDCPVY